MLTRRTFIYSTLSMFGGSLLGSLTLDQYCHAAEQLTVFKGEDVFNRILRKAEGAKWKARPIGESMGKIAKELEFTPYVANTLELSADREVCSVDLIGLDCVTFFESTLCFARMLKKGGRTPKALLKEVTFTRYRGGIVGDYTSRLHYTTDWFHDNEKKGVVAMLSHLPGSEPFTQKVGLMSRRADTSIQLAKHPELIPVIKKQEEAINSFTLTFVPLDKLAAVEPLLKTGDIVGLCTDVEGLDISHTGLIYRDQEDVVHFMDASSKKINMKVTIETGPISKSLLGAKNRTGVMFARPLEPVKS